MVAYISKFHSGACHVKIAIIHEDLSKKGGAENLIIWYSAELIKRGHDITLFTGNFKSDNWQEEYVSLLKVHEARHFGFTKNPFLYEIYGRKALSDLVNFDIVIVHVWLNASLSISFNRRKRRQQWVWFCEEPPRFIYFNEIEQFLLPYYENHIYYEPYQGINILKHVLTKKMLNFLKILDRIFVRRAFDRIIVNSNFTGSNIRKIYDRSSNVAHLGIGSHYVQSTYEDMKAKNNCDFLFFFSGRLDYSKNLVRVIRAFSKLQTDVNYKFVIAGNGILKKYLTEKIEKLGLSQNVKLAGFISNEDLVNHFNSADVIVYLPINEPFGLVPIEAMACGKPSIVSSFGGPSETITDGKTGFLVNPLNVPEITKKLDFILKNRHVLKEMELACKIEYQEKYTLSRGVDRFINALSRKP